jgi:hypothetical protein
MTLLTQLPLADLTTLALGISAGWLLLYLCGQFGALADRVALRPEAGGRRVSAYAAHPSTSPGGLPRC